MCVSLCRISGWPTTVSVSDMVPSLFSTKLGSEYRAVAFDGHRRSAAFATLGGNAPARRPRAAFEHPSERKRLRGDPERLACGGSNAVEADHGQCAPLDDGLVADLVWAAQEVLVER